MRSQRSTSLAGRSDSDRPIVPWGRRCCERVGRSDARADGPRGSPSNVRWPERCVWDAVRTAPGRRSTGGRRLLYRPRDGRRPPGPGAARPQSPRAADARGRRSPSSRARTTSSMPASTRRRPPTTSASSASTTRPSRPPRCSGWARRATAWTTRTARSPTGRRWSSSARPRPPTGRGGTSRHRASGWAPSARRCAPIARRTAGRPPEDKAEIANRLGWLAKETGDTGTAEALLRPRPRRRSAGAADDGRHHRDRRSSRSWRCSRSRERG